ncbi:hypothetical protein [Azospirillum argentinense]
MQSKIEMTDGRLRLKSIIDAFPPESPHWNEAQNRFQFVDRLLMECLGWEQPYIEVERFDDSGGRADYLFGKPVKAALEAKREAVKFDLLPAAKPAAVRKLRPLVASSKPLLDACVQVIQYCVLHGAQIAIVCNGPQMIIFQATIPGQSPLDGECYVFDGFAAYLNHFPLLWKLLSPEGVLENRAHRDLALHRNPRIPAKAATAIGEPLAYRYRTPFQENLRSLASILLDNIEDNPDVKSDFYKECYVPLEANNRHLLLSKNIIAARYKRVGDSGIAPAAMTTSVDNGRVHVDNDVLATALGSKPIVVIGDVGVGKTSFFENLYEQISKDEKQKTLYIHVNLGKTATLAKNVKEHILVSVPEIMRKNYNIDIDNSQFVDEIYSDDIIRFDSGVEGRLKSVSPIDYERAKIAFLSSKVKNRDLHLKAALSYLLRIKKKQIMIVIDNADQRSFDTQQEAFLIAQELSETRSTLVFVALRPSTFYQSKLTGALSGYQNRVLTISPPPADEVIRKRITFAVRVAEGKTAPAALEGVYLNIKSVVLFLTATLRSIKSNADIRTFLSNITGGNTRLVIELITTFCGSPNVESERIVRIEEESGDYKVPLHEFAKHALLGEYTYYNPTSSFVACNIFDISTPDPKEHFLCVLIVAYLTAPLGVKDNDGFVTAVNVLKEMNRLGFVDDQVRHALKRLATRRLIETPHGHYRELKVPEEQAPDAFHFRATSIGVYHIRFWAGSFAFLDAVSIDTPIFDETVRNVVFRFAESLEISERFAKTEQFKAYLEAQWQTASFEVSYYDYPQVATAQRESFSSVSRYLAQSSRPGANMRNNRRK